jgi:hypothetical protein
LIPELRQRVVPARVPQICPIALDPERAVAATRVPQAADLGLRHAA